MKDQYKYSVLDVCQDIHGDYCGSGDGIQTDLLKSYVEWLERRLVYDEGWDKHRCSYDACVYALATQALAEAKASLKSNKEYWERCSAAKLYEKSG